MIDEKLLIDDIKKHIWYDEQSYKECSEAKLSFIYKISISAYNIVLEKINQLAKEYNDGWLPCSEKLPSKNGWYECWYMKSAIGEQKEYEPITLYWEDNIWLYNPKKFGMPTQEDVIAWKPVTPYLQKGD